jgi:SOS-response transcriptional repressor LexA
LLLKLARLYEVDPDEIYRAFSYTSTKEERTPAKLNPHVMALAELEDVVKSLIPVYGELSADWFNAIDAIDYVAVSRTATVPESWRAYRIKGICLAPDINEGDTVVVDHALKDYRDGDLVACLKDGKAYVKRLKMRDSKPMLINNFGELSLKDCMVQGIVVQVIKKYR